MVHEKKEQERSNRPRPSFGWARSLLGFTGFELRRNIISHQMNHGREENFSLQPSNPKSGLSRAQEDTGQKECHQFGEIFRT